MRKRPTSPRPAGLAGLVRSVGLVIQRLIPAAPASRPVGGPVVFRHYL